MYVNYIFNALFRFALLIETESVTIEQLPQLAGIFRFNSATIANEISIALKKLNSFLSVGGYIVILILLETSSNEKEKRNNF